MTRKLDEILRRGLLALRRELGAAGMIRFLQQFETGSGNYARERRAWLDETSIQDIRAIASSKTREKK